MLPQIRKCLRDFRQNRSGAPLAVFGLTLVPLLLGLGVALDYGRGYNVRTSFQTVSDAAALFGASLFGDPGLSDADIERRVRGFIAGQVADKGLHGASHIPKITVNKEEQQVHVDIDGDMDTAVMGIASIDSVEIHATSTAKFEGNANLCVLALSENAQDSIYVHGSVEIAAPTCFFWANSERKSQAIRFQGAGSALTAGYCAVGAHAIQNFSVTPRPRDRCKAVPDPLADWVPPMVPAKCDFGEDEKGRIVGTTINGSGRITLSPGRYCGPTRVSASGEVELLPGRYFFTDGALRINSTARMHGEEVYIHLSQDAGSFDFSAGSGLELTRRDDPDLRQVLIYKQPGWDKKAKQSTLGASSETYIDGVIYAPKDKLVLSGNAELRMERPELTLIADTIEITGTARFEIASDPEFKTSIGPFGTSRLIK